MQKFSLSCIQKGVFMKPASIAFAALGTVVSLSLGGVLLGCQNTSQPAGNQAAPTAQNTSVFELGPKQELKLTIADLKKAQDKTTKGTLSSGKDTLTFDQKDISLVVATGPEDDMLSFRIQGVRNPTLKIPAGATIKILFVNADDDMTHDFLIGDLQRPIPDHPPTAGTVGSDRMEHAKNETYSAQQMTLTAPPSGVTTYFCSVEGHAEKGMWGTIVIGKVDSSQTIPSGHDAGEPHNHDSHMESDHKHSDT
jgi:rusticyanin